MHHFFLRSSFSAAASSIASASSRFSLAFSSSSAFSGHEPHLPTNQPGARRVNDRRAILASSMSVAAGAIIQRSTGRRRQSTIASTDGRDDASGALCSRRSPPAMQCPRARRSTRPTSRRSVPRSAEEAGGSAGTSCGGQTAKRYALTDVVGRPYAITLTPGNFANVSLAPALVDRAVRARHILADKGYDTDALRCAMRRIGAKPVTPGRRTRTKSPSATIACDIGIATSSRMHSADLKDFQRVATR